MPIRIYAGLMSVLGGLVIISIWAVFLSYGQPVYELSVETIIDQIVSTLSSGDRVEFFRYSVLCMLGCFIAGTLFFTGKLPILGIVIVAANSVAASVMFTWSVVVVIASPLLFTKWVLSNA